jgi:hypothetical protein
MLASKTIKSEVMSASTDVVARRLFESFLEDVNEFARSGSGCFQNCSESERRT